MKKKIRSITVDNQKFNWRVAEHDDDNGPEKWLTIWKDKNTKIFNEKIEASPATAITPSFVAEIIRNESRA